MNDLDQDDFDRLQAVLSRATRVATTAPPAPAPTSNRRRFLLVGGGAAAVVAGAGFAWLRAGSAGGQGPNPVAVTTAPAETIDVLEGRLKVEPTTSAVSPAVTGPDAAAGDTSVVEPATSPGAPTSEVSSPTDAISSSTAPDTTTPDTTAPDTPDTIGAAPAPSSAGSEAPLLTGTPTELLPGGQPWPNGLYIDGVMYMRGTLPDAQTSDELEARVEQILGKENVRNELVIDPTVPHVETVIVRLGQSVLFLPGSDTVNPEYYPGFQLWAAFLQSNPDVTVTVIGHTDNVGTAEYNLSLALRRAAAAKEQIVANGVDGARVEVVTKGLEDPVAPNDTEQGRALNRRIEFAVTGLFGGS